MTRFDTIQAASYLVWRLQGAGIAHHILDDGDLIVFKLKPRQEEVMIYMMERQPTLPDIQHHLEENTRQGAHTLFLFWVDMLLPMDGEPYIMPDWLEACAHLYGDKVYGFEVAGREAYFIPVHLQGQGKQRLVRYGGNVDYKALHTRSVSLSWPGLSGTWRVASFDRPQAAQQADAMPASAAALYYELLGLADRASLEQVKRAYRDLARQYHPDVNPNPQAGARMQQINDAYRHVLRHLDADET